MAINCITFYEKASVLLAGGIQYDENDQWDQAIRHYSKAMEYLLAGTNYDRMRLRREQKLKLLRQIMERAEMIQQTLQQQQQQQSQNQTTQKSSSATSTTKTAKTTSHTNTKQQPQQQQGKKTLSAEVEKLRNSLSDAIVSEKPNVQWDDVAGLDNAKKALEEALVLPRKYPQLFVGKRQPYKAILLYGPPGTGKSLLAKAAASSLDESSTFYSVSSSDLISKYQGESEKLVRNLFEMAAESVPSVIFIDEIDAICSRRGTGADEHESTHRVKNELLIQMQECPKGVFVLGATNRPYSLDPALRRRFDKRIYIPLPDESSRERILRIHLGDEPTKLSNGDLKQLAKISDGYSPADLSIVVRDALMQPVRQALRAKAFKRTLSGHHLIACDENEEGAMKMSLFDIKNPEMLQISDITVDNFKQSFERIRPSVSVHDVADAERFTEEFGEGETTAKARQGHTYNNHNSSHRQHQQTQKSTSGSSSTPVSPQELGKHTVVLPPPTTAKRRSLA